VVSGGASGPDPQGAVSDIAPADSPFHLTFDSDDEGLRRQRAVLPTILQDLPAELVHRPHGLGAIDIVLEVDQPDDGDDHRCQHKGRLGQQRSLASVHSPQPDKEEARQLTRFLPCAFCLLTWF